MRINNMFINGFVICFIFLIKAANLLANGGSCPDESITLATSDRVIIESCVNRCNQKANDYVLQRQAEIADPTAESWSGWLGETISNFAHKQLIAWDPNTQSKMGDFSYEGFKKKFDLLSRDNRLPWCLALISTEIPSYEKNNKYMVSKMVKGCASTLNLYEGCHSLCLKEVKKTCGV